MTRPFDRMTNETFRLVKQDGTVEPGLKSTGVKDGSLSFFREDIDFVVGDHLERDLLYGKLETWYIEDVEFKSKFHTIPARYVLKVRNAAKAREVSAPRSVTYNLYGANSRVNHHSTDHSHNTVQIDTADLFARVEEVLTEAVSNQEELQALQRQLAQMQAMRGQSTFAQSYVEFMSLAADHLTVLTPFLPALAQLLVFAGQAR